jgi:hypothetical protein
MGAAVVDLVYQPLNLSAKPDPYLTIFALTWLWDE